MQPFTAVLSGGRVVVPAQSDADSLMNDGYGSREGGIYVLEPIETLFNVEQGRVEVINEDDGRHLGLKELTQAFQASDGKAWTRYLVYRDLRTRGFTARRDPEGPADLVVYDRGAFKKGPPTIRVAIVSEGSPESLKGLLGMARGYEARGLQLKLAVVDRRGEMVYYGLSERSFAEEA
jgi:tRNA-intron endonuclease